ncbi:MULTISPECIES: Hsp20/alpha crystallin family protein [Emticicia]|uniref:Hsp20/alpha crystallin family protein n=1 Tax=Emticicia TaxID=312278 RepID=UPI000C786AF9|nr:MULTISPECIES: Hsp20/alpha crystallin family protein [Emticicia]PLK42580.1 heat-shock protein Hsp20 [Emticicia sp. TH156]UTA68400.1 Hsp20/alpha crystallin family protein [Emticicia sp. 21SJ11W-3]
MATLVRSFAPAFPSLLENFLNDFERVAPTHQHSFPAVNVLENENLYKLELAAPGLKKEDFKINVHENVLTISVEQKSETEQTQNNGKYTRKEFNYSSFKRSFTLPKTVDSEKIAAAYNDGVLALELPKKEEAKPKEPRLIEIA